MPTQKKLILAIDDDPAQCALIEGILKKKNYGIITLLTGREGLEAARTKKPDLILLDCVMPEMAGEEVCRRLKLDDHTKSIPVIFLTAQDSPKNVIEHYEMGADIHLSKPIDPKELISQIEISLQEASS